MANERPDVNDILSFGIMKKVARAQWQQRREDRAHHYVRPRAQTGGKQADINHNVSFGIMIGSSEYSGREADKTEGSIYL